jgi:hypothetical protein
MYYSFVLLVFLCCPAMCLYVLSSVLWCLLRFLYNKLFLISYLRQVALQVFVNYLSYAFESMNDIRHKYDILSDHTKRKLFNNTESEFNKMASQKNTHVF